jgi:hypothetical protein
LRWRGRRFGLRQHTVANAHAQAADARRQREAHTDVDHRHTGTHFDSRTDQRDPARHGDPNVRDTYADVCADRYALLLGQL